MTMLMSVAAMLCKSVVDFIGNLTARDNRKRTATTYYLIQNVTILLVLAVMLVTGLIKVRWDLASFLYSLAVGFFTFISYYFFLMGLTGGNGVAGTTIYRLNFIVSSVFGFALLGEKLTAGNAAGTVLCILAMLLFVGRFSLSGQKSLVYAVLASLTCGIMNLINKYAMNQGVTSDTLLTMRYLVAVALILALSRPMDIRFDRESLKAAGALLLPGAISGALMLLSMWFLYRALETGDLTVVMPVVQSCFIFTSVLCFIFLKEKPTARKIAGMAAAVASLVAFSL